MGVTSSMPAFGFSWRMSSTKALIDWRNWLSVTFPKASFAPSDITTRSGWSGLMPAPMLPMELYDMYAAPLFPMVLYTMPGCPLYSANPPMWALPVHDMSRVTSVTGLSRYMSVYPLPILVEKRIMSPRDSTAFTVNGEPEWNSLMVLNGFISSVRVRSPTDRLNVCVPGVIDTPVNCISDIHGVFMSRAVCQPLDVDVIL